MHEPPTGAPPHRRSTRPRRLAVVCGTGTEVGKTWVAAAVLRECRRRGLSVAARKPAQSFDPHTDGDGPKDATDAEVLAAASGEDPAAVCHENRSFPRALAPPMAAEALGMATFTVDELIGELEWPPEPVTLGVVELAGGVRSPQAADGDATDLLRRLRPDAVVLVSGAGLGAINDVRLSVAALATVTGGTGRSGPTPVYVVLDRFDAGDDVHRRNRRWLSDRDGLRAMVLPGEESELADALIGVSSPGGISDGRRSRRQQGRSRTQPPPPG
jgi:dethiobiotin synthetase